MDLCVLRPDLRTALNMVMPTNAAISEYSMAVAPLSSSANEVSASEQSSDFLRAFPNSRFRREIVCISMKMKYNLKFYF